MKRSRTFLTIIVMCLLLSLVWVVNGQAASAKLRYGFKPGTVYRVTQQHHDVGKTVTEMNMMGQQQTFESPSDRVSSGTWTMKAVGKTADGIKLQAEYGQHKGGERWSSNKVQSGDIFGNSSAEIIVHPVKGVVSVKASPSDDQYVEIIYMGRFAWMPELPEGGVNVGSEFTHEYVLKSGMYNVKVTDDYYVAEIKGGYVTFDVETREIAVIKMNSAQRPEGMPAGMGMDMADMKIAYKGEGTAVFDLKEGIFIEREGKMSYSNMDSTKGSSPMPGGMSFSSRMEGVSRYSFEMERE
jgi:hypothetical protein